MRLLEPLTPDPRAPLADAHPLAKIGAALILMLTLFLTIDPVTPALLLLALLAAVLLIGVPLRGLARRAAPVGMAAVGIGFFNALVSGDPASGVAIALRLATIGLAGMVAVASVDPTELADALVEHLHAPRRFTIGALAAFRMMPLFADEWQTITLARRARGIGDTGFVARIAGFFPTTRTLLVAAIRRATRLALAMDGRGFADANCRTLARPRGIDRGDWLLIIGTVAVAAMSSGASIALGSWRFLVGG